ncbi:MAG: hypothetical protein GXX92_08485 [Clostridiales bacterium]|nr:hypothetical protein [Clostridiales bacterium]
MDVLKITSPVEVKNKIQNIPRQQPTDAIFDLLNPTEVTKEPGKVIRTEEDGTKEALLRNLNREIHRPLLNQTKAQADTLRKLVLYAKLFEVSSGIITEDFLHDFFLRPKELLGELLKNDSAATVFKGDFFEALRILAQNPEHPKLQEAILSILKHYDCYVNRDNSLQSIQMRSNSLSGLLLKGDKQILEGQMEKLEALLGVEENYKETIKFLKNEFVPALRGIAVNYPPTDKVQDIIISIIHYIVRYDKGDLQLLEDAFAQFSEELRPLFAHLTDDDIKDMKDALLRGEEQSDKEEIKTVIKKEDSDMATLLSKALDKSSPAKLSGVAQNLLLYMVQSESPMLPLLHFMIPLRFLDDDTYGEFFIDKECSERKGDAKQATNIFFTIQSDLYGTFEVDLLARDRNIDLDIKCPQELQRGVKEIKSKLKDLIEAQGYRLMGYQVGEYGESKTILKRFSQLAGRKVGIDVKI